jgi:NADPH2 dehydrogenase
MSAAPKVATSSSRLVQPLKLGDREIHRVAMAPLTRMRAEKGTQIPSPHAAEYYSQRATEGGLILSEATFVAEEAAGYPMAPGE